MGGGLESRCVGCVYGADGAVHHPHRTHHLRSGSQGYNIRHDLESWIDYLHATL